jgi:hypothetical protein
MFMQLYALLDIAHDHDACCTLICACYSRQLVLLISHDHVKTPPTTNIARAAREQAAAYGAIHQQHHKYILE